MVACPPPSFLSRLFFLITFFFYACRPPLYFPVRLCTLHKLWPDNSVSAFNAIMPQFRGSVNQPPILILHTATDITQHITHCPQLFSLPAPCKPLRVYRDSWIVDLILNLWPAGIRENCRVCVCARPGVTDSGHGSGGWILYKEMCQTSQRFTDPECPDRSSASLNSKDEEKICWETERPYTQGWAAVDHKELMASIEIEQETCSTTTPWSPFLPEVSATAWGLLLTKGRGMWAEFYDQLFNETWSLFQLFITQPSRQAQSDASFCLVVVKHLLSKLERPVSLGI